VAHFIWVQLSRLLLQSLLDVFDIGGTVYAEKIVESGTSTFGRFNCEGKVSSVSWSGTDLLTLTAQIEYLMIVSKGRDKRDQDKQHKTELCLPHLDPPPPKGEIVRACVCV
jgi:hypothetical protein